MMGSQAGYSGFRSRFFAGEVKTFFSSLLISFFVSVPSFVFSQASISGSAPSFAGKEIRLYTYKDYITMSRVLIESTLVSADGRFRFSLPENVAYTTFLGIFKIENFAAILYIEPNTELDISLVKPDSVQFPDDKVSYIDAFVLNQTGDGLNFLLRDFDEKYNRFVYDHYALFLKKSAKGAVDSFKTKVLDEYDLKKNPFLKTHITYYLASLDLIATGNRKKIYTDYFASAPIEYGNDSYMISFNEFYNKAFELLSDSYLRDLLVASINVQKSYEKAMDVLSKDVLLGNEKIRELVLMKGLFENYNNPEFDKKGIRAVFQGLVQTSKVPQHREIAMNILEETGRVGVGANAPDFSLADKNNKPVKLSDFRGKYVYLDFWATWCIPCLKEMPIMKELHEKYGKDIVFVSISVDKDLKTMQKFLNKKKDYDWVFLHYGNNPGIKEQYNVMAVPVYFLIDPDGIIIQSPAYRPSGKIEETFINISSGKKTKRKPYEWGW